MEAPKSPRDTIEANVLVGHNHTVNKIRAKNTAPSRINNRLRCRLATMDVRGWKLSWNVMESGNA